MQDLLKRLCGLAGAACLLFSAAAPAQELPPPDPGPSDTLITPPPPSTQRPPPPKSAKVPRPADADLRKAEQKIRTEHKQAIQSGDRLLRLALADKLLTAALAMGPGTDDAEKFAMLKETLKLSAVAEGLDTAFRAAEALDVAFEDVDVAVLKMEALSASMKGSKTQTALEAIAAHAADLVEEALEQGAFKTAAKAARSFKTVARTLRDAEQLKLAQDYEKRIPLLEREFAAAEKARVALGKDPDDANANLTYGTYLCGREEWDAAVSHLAKGSDADLRAAAGLDAGKPSTAKDRVAAAEAWEAAARKGKAPLERERYFGRAVFWYQSALAVTGSALQKIRIERKLAELDKEVPGRSVEVTFHWSCADDADVYVNGKPLRTYEPDFRTRPDEAPRAFSCEGRLGRGDVITVGARRGGSFGITLVAVDKRGRVVWKTDTRTWRVYFPPSGTKEWFKPSVTRGAKSEPAKKAQGWPPQTRINNQYAKGKAESVWHTPTTRTCFLYSIVR